MILALGILFIIIAVLCAYQAFKLNRQETKKLRDFIDRYGEYPGQLKSTGTDKVIAILAIMSACLGCSGAYMILHFIREML